METETESMWDDGTRKMNTTEIPDIDQIPKLIPLTPECLSALTGCDAYVEISPNHVIGSRVPEAINGVQMIQDGNNDIPDLQKMNVTNYQLTSLHISGFDQRRMTFDYNAELCTGNDDKSLISNGNTAPRNGTGNGQNDHVDTKETGNVTPLDLSLGSCPLNLSLKLCGSPSTNNPEHVTSHDDVIIADSVSEKIDRSCFLTQNVECEKKNLRNSVKASYHRATGDNGSFVGDKTSTSVCDVTQKNTTDMTLSSRGAIADNRPVNSLVVFREGDTKLGQSPPVCDNALSSKSRREAFDGRQKTTGNRHYDQHHPLDSETVGVHSRVILTESQQHTEEHLKRWYIQLRDMQAFARKQTFDNRLEVTSYFDRSNTDVVCLSAAPTPARHQAASFTPGDVLDRHPTCRKRPIQESDDVSGMPEYKQPRPGIQTIVMECRNDDRPSLDQRPEQSLNTNYKRNGMRLTSATAPSIGEKPPRPAHLKLPRDILYIMCNVCGLTYGNIAGMKKHLQRDHSIEFSMDKICVQTISDHKREHGNDERPHVIDRQMTSNQPQSSTLRLPVDDRYDSVTCHTNNDVMASHDRAIPLPGKQSVLVEQFQNHQMEAGSVTRDEHVTAGNNSTTNAFVYGRQSCYLRRRRLPRPEILTSSPAETSSPPMIDLTRSPEPNSQNKQEEKAVSEQVDKTAPLNIGSQTSLDGATGRQGNRGEKTVKDERCLAKHNVEQIISNDEDQNNRRFLLGAVNSLIERSVDNARGVPEGGATKQVTDENYNSKESISNEKVEGN